MNDDKKASRREFLRGLGRAAAAAGIVGGVGALVATGKALPSQKCVNKGYCRACQEYDDCGLPAALSAKREGMER